MHPTMAQKLKNAGEHQALFIDFFKSGGDLNKCEFIQRRRHELKQQGSKVYSKLLEKDLMDRYGDATYVEKIKAERIKLRRFSTTA